jgi:hypothetical protein
MAGLPSGWQEWTIRLLEQGSSSFDGTAFRLRAGGSSGFNQGASGFLVHHAMLAVGSFTVRVSPIFASQFLKFGIALLTDAKVPQVEALLFVSPRGETERPAWSAYFLRPAEAGIPLQTIGSHSLAAPTVAYGRLVEPLWLRLERAGTTIDAALSPDGRAWSEIGTTKVASGGLRVGLFLNSGEDKLTTEACFDQVSLNKSRETIGAG